MSKGILIYANKLNINDNILNPDLKPQYSLTRPGSKESEAIGKMMRAIVKTGGMEKGSLVPKALAQ